MTEPDIEDKELVALWFVTLGLWVFCWTFAWLVFQHNDPKSETGAILIFLFGMVAMILTIIPASTFPIKEVISSIAGLKDDP